MVWKLTFVWKTNPINAYEPCQVRKEAAISSVIYVEVVFHREVRAKPFSNIRM